MSNCAANGANAWLKILSVTPALLKMSIISSKMSMPPPPSLITPFFCLKAIALIWTLNSLWIIICKWSTPTEGVQRDSYEKEFIKNVKDRIKEIQNRDYINPSENTLDFVLLFIPNEQVFGLIQEKMPDVMDFALKQKVVLCSPFTLYAMLSVVRQAHEHFRFEKDIKKIIEFIEGFTKDYELFKNRFADLGLMIESLAASIRISAIKVLRNWMARSSALRIIKRAT